MLPTDGDLAKRYEQLETERTSFLARAREVATLTIPTLMPPKDIVVLQCTQPHTKA